MFRALADVTPKPAQEALRIFFEVREVPDLKKKPSTSELLDWLKLLLNEDITRATSDFLGRPDDARARTYKASLTV